MEKTNILVTGGAGFIGSHLCERLIQQGYCVANIDNFNDFYSPQAKLSNVKKIRSHQDYHLYQGDIRDVEFVENVISAAKTDVIIHLAAMAGVQPSLKDPALYNDVNVTGTLNLLQAAQKYTIDRFIFASSSSIYGNNKTPFSESDNTDFPVSPYASTKKTGELMCHVYHHLYGLSAHCLRFFTVVGPRQRPDLAVHKFVKDILSGETIYLRGDLSSSRDYTHVNDTVDGIIGSLQRIMKLKKPEYKVYNLGNSYPVRLDDMLSTIESVLGKKAIVEKVPFMKGDVDSTYADITLAQKELNYSPKASFREAVESFVAWYMETH